MTDPHAPRSSQPFALPRAMAVSAALATAFLGADALAQIGKDSMNKSPFDQAAQPTNGNDVVDISYQYLPEIPGRNTSGLAFTFTIEPGWHLYWKNNGDTGMPIMLDLDLPPGVAANDVLWPAPKRYEHSGGLLDYIYEDEVTLIVPIASGRDGGTTTASIEFLVCQEACIPGVQTLDLMIPAANARTDPAPTIDTSRFPIPAGDSAEWRWDGTTLVLEAKEAESMTFYPESGENVRPVNALRDGAAKGDTLRFAYRDAVRNASVVRGVLEVRNTAGETAFYEVQIAAPR